MSTTEIGLDSTRLDSAARRHKRQLWSNVIESRKAVIDGVFFFQVPLLDSLSLSLVLFLYQSIDKITSISRVHLDFVRREKKGPFFPHTVMQRCSRTDKKTGTDRDDNSGGRVVTLTVCIRFILLRRFVSVYFILLLLLLLLRRRLGMKLAMNCRPSPHAVPYSCWVFFCIHFCCSSTRLDGG